MRLVELPFADLAVERQPTACRFKQFSGDLRLDPVPESLWGELERLYARLAQLSEARFRLTWDGVLLRGQRRETPNGPVFVLRRIAGRLLRVDELGIPPPIIQKLRHPDLRSGLVLFAGGPGAGKTTAACALLIDRLERIGGFAWTAENPVEYDLQGPHGRGQCYQEEIGEDAEIQRVLMDTLRSSADMLYIGEIREESSAKAACLAAASGMLVLSTLHADNAPQALLKIGLLAGADGLSQSLRAIVTLRMDRELTAANGPKKVLRVQPFFVEDEAIRMKIAKGDLAALSMDIEMQRNRMVMGGGMC